MNINSIKVISGICLCVNLALIQCPVHGVDVEDASNVGFITIQQSGTASSASGVTEQMAQVQWIPAEGRPAIEYIDLDHKKRLMENETEIQNG